MKVGSWIVMGRRWMVPVRVLEMVDSYAAWEGMTTGDLHCFGDLQFRGAAGPPWGKLER